MRNGYFVTKNDGAKTLYYACPKNEKNAIYLSKEMIPKNSLRGRKPDIELFAEQFSCRSVPKRHEGKSLLKFYQKWTRY